MRDGRVRDSNGGSPSRRIKLDPIEERHCNEPRIAMDGDERKPISLLHPVPGKVNSQARLGELSWDLLDG